MSIAYQLAPLEPELDTFDGILDHIVLLVNQCMSSKAVPNTSCISRANSDGSPFLFVIRNETIHEVKVFKKTTFSKMFDELIGLLRTHHRDIPVNLSSPTLISLYKDLLAHVGSVSKIADDIMLSYGGSMFPMFPPCVGYVLNRQHESLFCVQPREMYEINDEVFSQYVSRVLREHFG